MPRIFAYIAHKGGVVDDSAAELAAAREDRSPAVSHGDRHRLGRRSRCRSARACALRTASLEDRQRRWPIPMPNWFARPW
jgi:hypothetical protein